MTAKKLVVGDEFIFLRFSLSLLLAGICSRIFGVGVCVLKRGLGGGGGISWHFLNLCRHYYYCYCYYCLTEGQMDNFVLGSAVLQNN